ncbi:hypothetical protein J6I75_06230 [Pseudidiomarina sp. 1APP75-27a]|uniref:hypothetical protein n=1 Tax=Pseudidiomarina terrestris TaxID=2820060 RepID=UPI002B0603A0|nr:hypothetical protein [Pseudidiomarina sp. 1APP75-27a]MEA3587945.1 hypothetical protein [Pseudidiomarina sp. 1APP75-27a]
MKLYRYLLDWKLESLLNTSKLHQTKLTESSNTEVPDGLITELDRMMMSGEAEQLDILMNLGRPSPLGARFSSPNRVAKLTEQVKNGYFVLLERTFDRKSHDVQSILAKLRRHIYISCWTKNASNSQYMWNEFGTDKLNGCKNSVRIETSNEQLNSSIIHDDSVVVTMDNVGYIDFDRETTGKDAYSINPFIHKPSRFKGHRKEFPEEDEFRVVAYLKSFDIESSGLDALKLNVDLNKLITGVTVNPQADSSYAIAVQRLLSDSGLSHVVVK